MTTTRTLTRSAPAPVTPLLADLFVESGALRLRLHWPRVGSHAAPLGTRLHQLERVPSIACAVLVVDVSEVLAMDAGSARVLCNGRRALRTWGWRVCCTQPSPAVATVLHLAAREASPGVAHPGWEFLPYEHPWSRVVDEPRVSLDGPLPRGALCSR